MDTLSHRRVKRLMPKVKTGCSVCKKRRIKCDETKPHCHRCRRSGIGCPGYVPPKVWLFDFASEDSIGGRNPHSQSDGDRIEMQVDQPLQHLYASAARRAGSDAEAGSSPVTRASAANTLTRKDATLWKIQQSPHKLVPAASLLMLTPSSPYGSTEEQRTLKVTIFGDWIELYSPVCSFSWNKGQLR